MYTNNSNKETDQVYQGTVSLKEWNDLLKGLNECYWKDSLERSPIKKKEWFFSSSKALFYRSIDCSRKDYFLEIGAGSGIISSELSKEFGSGVTLDYLPEAVKFMNMRFQQDSIHNLHVVHGNGLSLPFNNDIFDLIICNGILEWIAYFANGKNCRHVQIEFLQEAFRCLRDTGKIGIAIENRWALSHFRGESPHGEPPYVVLLPRLLARAVNLVLRKRDYRLYLYSFYGYKKLLEAAGFRNIRISLAVPNYYYPEYICNMDRKSLEALFYNKHCRRHAAVTHIKKFLNQLGLLKFFWSSFFIEAEKSP